MFLQKSSGSCGEQSGRFSLSHRSYNIIIIFPQTNRECTIQCNCFKANLLAVLAYFPGGPPGLLLWGIGIPPWEVPTRGTDSRKPDVFSRYKLDHGGYTSAWEYALVSPTLFFRKGYTAVVGLQPFYKMKLLNSRCSRKKIYKCSVFTSVESDSIFALVVVFMSREKTIGRPGYVSFTKPIRWVTWAAERHRGR